MLLNTFVNLIPMPSPAQGSKVHLRRIVWVMPLLALLAKPTHPLMKKEGQGRTSKPTPAVRIC